MSDMEKLDRLMQLEKMTVLNHITFKEREERRELYAYFRRVLEKKEVGKNYVTDYELDKRVKSVTEVLSLMTPQQKQITHTLLTNIQDQLFGEIKDDNMQEKMLKEIKDKIKSNSGGLTKIEGI